MTEFKRLINRHSINNLRIGEVLSRSDQWLTVRVGQAKRTLRFSGSAAAGDVVTLECPEGDLNKGHVVEVSPLILGDGGIIEV